MGFLTGLIFAGGVVLVHSLFFQEDGHVGLEPTRSSRIEAAGQERISSPLLTKESQNVSHNAKQAIEEIAKVRSAFLRSKTLHGLLAEGDQHFIHQLFVESQTISSITTRQEIQETIIRWYATTDPRHAVSVIGKLSEEDQVRLIQSLFQEWSLSNLDDAVSFANELDDFMKYEALRGILKLRDNLSQREYLDISIRLDSPVLGIAKVVRAWEDQGDTIDEPEFVWNLLLEQSPTDGKPVSVWHQHLLRKIAKAWLDQSGIDALTKINESVLNEIDRISVVSSVLGHLALSNPQQAFDSALRFTDSNLRIVGRTVRAWAQHDPKSALDAVSMEENWNTRRTLQIEIISIWAFNEPIELLDRLDELPSGIQETAQIGAFGRLANTSPETATQLFEEVKTRELKKTIAKEIAKTWMRHDLAAALRWAKSDPNVSEIRREVIASVLRKLAQDDPQLAVQQALQEPATDGESGIESDVIFEVARRNVEQAIQLLPLARNDTTRNSAYRWVGIELVNDGESKTAIDLGNELSEASRTQYLRHIFARLAYVNPSELLSRINLLPSELTKNNVANTLLSNDQVRERLTRDQIEALTAHQR